MEIKWLLKFYWMATLPSLLSQQASGGQEKLPRVNKCGVKYILILPLRGLKAHHSYALQT